MPARCLNETCLAATCLVATCLAATCWPATCFHPMPATCLLQSQLPLPPLHPQHWQIWRLDCIAVCPLLQNLAVCHLLRCLAVYPLLQSLAVCPLLQSVVVCPLLWSIVLGVLIVFVVAAVVMWVVVMWAVVGAPSLEYQTQVCALIMYCNALQCVAVRVCDLTMCRSRSQMANLRLMTYRMPMTYSMPHSMTYSMLHSRLPLSIVMVLVVVMMCVAKMMRVATCLVMFLPTCALILYLCLMMYPMPHSRQPLLKCDLAHVLRLLAPYPTDPLSPLCSKTFVRLQSLGPPQERMQMRHVTRVRVPLVRLPGVRPVVV
mmetsp:Transcript_59938/g.97084  ORF Transcript_59938/g.97084 Transcript_59938/m.97084 type:complete len:317 (+) Transcript_59938:329-1279(+)